MRTLKISDCLPVDCVRDNAIIAKDGSITIGWELCLNPELSLTQQAYDSHTSMLASAFRLLPDWTMVHRQDVYSRKSYEEKGNGHFLDDAYEEHFRGREYLSHRQFIWFTLNPWTDGKEGALTDPTRGAAVGACIRRDAGEDLLERLVAFENRCEEFIRVFCTPNGIGCRRLNTTDLEGEGTCRGILDSYLNWFDPDESITSDLIQKDGTYLERDGRRLYSYSISCPDDICAAQVSNTVAASSHSEDSDRIVLSSSSPIGAELDCEHIVNFYFLLPSQAEARSGLERSMYLKRNMSRNDFDNTENSSAIEQFIRRVSREGTSIVYMHMNLMLWADRTRQQYARGLASSALSRMGMIGKINTCDTPQLFFAGLPGAQMQIGRDNLMIAELEQALCLCINETFTRGVAGGALRLCDPHRHIPIPMDFQQGAMDANLLDSCHAIVIGPTGSGKSFFTNWYTRSLYGQGQHVFIIDKGGSYRLNAMLINELSGGRDGIYHEWSSEHPMSFNPLDGLHGWLREDSSGMNFFMAVLKTIWTPEGGWEATRENILRQTVIDFIESLSGSGRPVMTDYIRFVGQVIAPRIDRTRREKGREYRSYSVGGLSEITPDLFDVNKFLAALGPYEEGNFYGHFFNNPDPPQLFDSRFVVFDIDRLDDPNQQHLFSLTTLCIMHAFEDKMRGLPGYKTMVIEEAWKAISTKAMEGYIKELWKTARKFNTSAMVVTQQIDDLVSSQIIRDAIVDNSHVKILLDQKNNAASFDRMCDVLGIQGMNRALVKSVGRDIDPKFGPYKEVFIDIGGKLSGVYAIEVSPEEALVYESKYEKKVPLLNEWKRCGSLRDAVINLSKRSKPTNGM